MNTSKFIDIEDYRQMLRKLQTSTLSGFASQAKDVQTKSDGSPITATDKANHDYLCQSLPKLRPVPVFSEEDYPDFKIRAPIKEYWLIDPIDGTKEFAAGIPEFCVLISLMADKRPVFATILAPTQNTCYRAELGHGAVMERNGEVTIFAKKPTRSKTRGLLSLFHEEPEIQSAYKACAIETFVRKGSALKFPSLLLDEADVYYRKRGPHEWDIAAGDLLLREAGGELLCLATGGSLVYNQEQTRVPAFLAAAPGIQLSADDVQKFRANAGLR